MDFAVLDIESMRDKKRPKELINTKFLCIGGYDGENFEWFKSIGEYMDYIMDDETYPENIFAHYGGGYDFKFVLNYLFSKRGRKKYNYLSEKVPTIDINSTILLLTVEDIRTKRKIKFWDSTFLLSFSLKKLSQSFGVETLKGEWDHSKTRGITKPLIAYLKDDCLALFQVLTKFSNWPLIKKAGMKTTKASQAFHVFFKSYWPEGKKKPWLSENVDEFCRLAYAGGRTEIFRPYFKGNEKKKLYYYDVNSLYPTVMASEEFPACFKYYSPKLLKKSMGIYHCRVSVPDSLHIPFLGVNHDGKYIFPVGEFDGYWTNKELEYAKTLGCKIIRIYKGAIFENGGRIFKKYITDVYKRRLQAKKEGDGVGNIICKDLMNCLYGRFALRKDKEQIVIFYKGLAVERIAKKLNPPKKYAVIQTEDKKLIQLSTIDKKLRTNTHVGIATFVTAYSRILMHKLMMVSPKEVYYSDTDSIFTTKKFPTGDKLGQLKLEYTLDEACFLLPKTYMLKKSSGLEVKMKGFDGKKLGGFTMTQFLTALEGSLRVDTKEGISQVMGDIKIETDPKIVKFKTGLKKGDFLANTEKSTKQLRSKYDKRIIYKKGGQYLTKPRII